MRQAPLLLSELAEHARLKLLFDITEHLFPPVPLGEVAVDDPMAKVQHAFVCQGDQGLPLVLGDEDAAEIGGTRGRNLLLEEIFNEIWAKLLVAIVSTSKFRMKFLEIWATFCEILKRNLGDLKRNPWLGQFTACSPSFWR